MFIYSGNIAQSFVEETADESLLDYNSDAQRWSQRVRQRDARTDCLAGVCSTDLRLNTSTKGLKQVYTSTQEI